MRSIIEFFTPGKAAAITATGRKIIDQVTADMIEKRDMHLSEMTRLEDIMQRAETEMIQHREAYEAYNQTLFAITNPAHAAIEAQLADDLDAELNSKPRVIITNPDLSQEFKIGLRELAARTDTDY